MTKPNRRFPTLRTLLEESTYRLPANALLPQDEDGFWILREPLALDELVDEVLQARPVSPNSDLDVSVDVQEGLIALLQRNTLVGLVWERHVFVARTRSFHALSLDDRCLWVEYGGASGEDINLLAVSAEGDLRQKRCFVEQLLSTDGAAFHTWASGGEPPDWIETPKSLEAAVRLGMTELLLDADSEFWERLQEWHPQLFDEPLAPHDGEDDDTTDENEDDESEYEVGEEDDGPEEEVRDLVIPRYLDGALHSAQ